MVVQCDGVGPCHWSRKITSHAKELKHLIRWSTHFRLVDIPKKFKRISTYGSDNARNRGTSVGAHWHFSSSKKSFEVRDRKFSWAASNCKVPVHNLVSLKLYDGQTQRRRSMSYFVQGKSSWYAFFYSVGRRVQANPTLLSTGCQDIKTQLIRYGSIMVLPWHSFRGTHRAPFTPFLRHLGPSYVLLVINQIIYIRT